MRGRVASAIGRRRRVRLDLLLAVLVVLAVGAAILVRQGAASSERLASSTPNAVAAAFSQAYLAYLDGRLPAGSLPDASARARAVAAGSPPIPTAARRGALKLAGLRVSYVHGALAGRAGAVGRDQAHRYGFTIALRYLSGRWQVVYLIPPDVYTIIATRHRAPAVPAALKRAASSFALAYVAYREGTRHSPPTGAATLAQQIAAGRDPLAHLTPSHAAPRLASVQIGPPVEGAAAASAVLTDGGRKLHLVFDLERSAGRWVASGFPEAG